MLAKGRANLKIEEIRMHKRHEIHRVKPIMPALCRIRQGTKIINWETHSLTVDNDQVVLFPSGYEFYIANYPEVGLYLAEMLYFPIDLMERYPKYLRGNPSGASHNRTLYTSESRVDLLLGAAKNICFPGFFNSTSGTLSNGRSPFIRRK